MYDVVVLVEEELRVPDAERLVDLYAKAPEPIKFHVIIPRENAHDRVQASLRGIASTELFGMATQRYALQSDEEVRKAEEEAQRASDAQVGAALDRSLGRLRSFGREAEGLITRRHPVDELVDHIKDVAGREVVVLTRPHIVAELLHIDWSAQARRHLGVPVLHLLERHQDSPAEPER